MTDKTLPKLDWRVVFNRAGPLGVRGWGRVRAAQLAAMRPAMTVAAWGQAFNALFIAYMLSGRVSPSALGLWLFCVSLLMLYFTQQQRKLREQRSTREIQAEAEHVHAAQTKPGAQHHPHRTPPPGGALPDVKGEPA